jgi:hypothetical protein
MIPAKFFMQESRQGISQVKQMLGRLASLAIRYLKRIYRD